MLVADRSFSRHFTLGGKDASPRFTPQPPGQLSFITAVLDMKDACPACCKVGQHRGATAAPECSMGLTEEMVESLFICSLCLMLPTSLPRQLNLGALCDTASVCNSPQRLLSREPGLGKLPSAKECTESPALSIALFYKANLTHDTL